MVKEQQRTPPTEKQLASYFAKYEPAIAKLGKALRAKLRARLPGLFEVVYVYENQGSLVISYSPTEQGYDGVCGLSLSADGAKLYFTNGALLSKSDPQKLLRGSAKARYVALSSVADFDRVEIEKLMAAALELARVELDASAKGQVVIRAEAQKKRASRAKVAARPATAGGKGEAKAKATTKSKKKTKAKATSKATSKSATRTKAKSRTDR